METGYALVLHYITMIPLPLSLVRVLRSIHDHSRSVTVQDIYTGTCMHLMYTCMIIGRYEWVEKNIHSVLSSAHILTDTWTCTKHIEIYNKEHEHQLDFFSSRDCVVNLIDASCSANEFIPSYFLHSALAIFKKVTSMLVFSFADVSMQSSMCFVEARVLASLRETCLVLGSAVAMSLFVPTSSMMASGPARHCTIGLDTRDG